MGPTGKNLCLKNPGDENLMEAKLKTVIDNGGEELQKLTYQSVKFGARDEKQ